MRIIYAATPDFAVAPLKAIIDKKKKIDLIITQPDKINARGNKVIVSPIKEMALQYNIQLFQPQNINAAESIIYIKSLKPELLITAAYGQILKEEVLNIPLYGCINIHASLLPKLRGAAPINRAIMNGSVKSGITIMKMDRGMDTGDIILQKEILIDSAMTAGILHDKLSQIGAELMIKFLENVAGCLANAKKQDDSQASLAPKILKEELFIDFNDNSQNIYNKIRGLSPQPTARCILNNKILKIYQCEIVQDTFGKKAGEVIYFDKKNGFVIMTKDNAIRLKKVQLEGKKVLDDTQFIIGYNIKEGIDLK
jgi:methionyl-tRNA formyltransferase